MHIFVMPENKKSKSKNMHAKNKERTNNRAQGPLQAPRGRSPQQGLLSSQMW